MTFPEIALVIAIAIVVGFALIAIGVLIEFSLRKKLPQPSVAAAEPVHEPEPAKPRGETALEAVPAPEIAAPPPAAAPRRPPRLGLGLRKTREGFLSRIRAAITGKVKLDEIYEGLEEALIAADVGVEAATKLVDAVRSRLTNDVRPDAIRETLKGEIAAMLTAVERPPADPGDAPLVIMLVGVNGVGKTTTVAKLAAWLKQERGAVIVAAAGHVSRRSYRATRGLVCARRRRGHQAGAGFRSGGGGLRRGKGCGRAQSRRGHNGYRGPRADQGEPDGGAEEDRARRRSRTAGCSSRDVLVLDATTGQNALSQAKIFGEAVPLTGVILAKLDSTARGGVIVGIADRLELPVRFVGIGENIEDMRAFDAREFVDALFSSDDSGEERVDSGSYAA